MDRRQRILEMIDVATGVGLELGPLHAPIVRREDGTVLYADHVSTDALRQHYRDDQNVTDIVDVDIVLAGRSLSEALGPAAPVDYVVASHVIEHVPDPIGWLADMAAIVRPGGVLSLAVPDKRYSFDAKRRCTELSELVDAYLEQRRHPSVAQVFDFYAKAAFSVTTAGLWAGDDRPTTLPDDDAGALRAARQAHDQPGALEVHCTVFTDASFVDLLERLAVTGLLPPFEVAAFHPTEPGSVEFHVSLRRLPDGLSRQERAARQQASLPPRPGKDDPPPQPLTPVEVRLVAAKRRAITALRQLPGAARVESWLSRTIDRGGLRRSAREEG